MGYVRDALAHVAAPRESDGRIVIDLPVMYPSGAMASVHADLNDDKVLVSDMGQGLAEAELRAADGFYAGAASRIADEFSVTFDGYAIFAHRVPLGRIEAAIACVANASCRAAAEAVRRATEARARNHNGRVFERVSRVFGADAVARTAEVAGRHVNWEAHNVIHLPGGRLAVFESMTDTITSISNKFMMFSDIRAADAAISLNSVVADLETFDERAQLIADIAHIVPLNASDDTFRRFAEAG
jgi:hypothetical protein